MQESRWRDCGRCLQWQSGRHSVVPHAVQRIMWLASSGVRCRKVRSDAPSASLPAPLPSACWQPTQAHACDMLELQGPIRLACPTSLPLSCRPRGLLGPAGRQSTRARHAGRGAARGEDAARLPPHGRLCEALCGLPGCRAGQRDDPLCHHHAAGQRRHAAGPHQASDRFSAAASLLALPPTYLYLLAASGFSLLDRGGPHVPFVHTRIFVPSPLPRPRFLHATMHPTVVQGATRRKIAAHGQVMQSLLPRLARLPSPGHLLCPLPSSPPLHPPAAGARAESPSYGR